MKQLLYIATLFLFVQTASAFNPFWVHTDKRLIKRVVQLDKNNPQAVEHYFSGQKTQKNEIEKEKLGFGWTMRTFWKSGGYISISATFFYYHDTIVSYSINPQMPEEGGLIKRYKTWYQGSFSFESYEISPFYYKPDKILKPLNEYKGTLTPQAVNRKIVEYMTPYSGRMYGYAGGYSNRPLQNRKAFIGLGDSLTNDQVVFLMYSLNPASRFTAIEYYLRHKDSFSNQQALDEWMELNFNEIPTIQTLSGCIRESYDTRSLVEMYSSMEVEK
jgi:hypothetical protein